MLMEPRAAKLSPQSPINAKFSLPYTVGLALSRGRVTLDDFGPESLADAAILSLAKRVTYEEIPGWGMDRAASGELDLRLKDGRVLSRKVDPARGHPLNPVTRDELAAKFRDCAARAANPPSAAESERLIGAVLALEDAQDVGQALFPGPTPT
jgi:2-methylcitrate dehydratase PrpD